MLHQKAVKVAGSGRNWKEGGRRGVVDTQNQAQDLQQTHTDSSVATIPYCKIKMKALFPSEIERTNKKINRTGKKNTCYSHTEMETTV